MKFAITVKAIGKYSNDSSKVNKIIENLEDDSRKLRETALQIYAKRIIKYSRMRIATERARTNSRYQSPRPAGGGMWDTRYSNISLKDMFEYSIVNVRKVPHLKISVGGMNGRVDARLHGESKSTVTPIYSNSRFIRFYSYMYNRMYYIPRSRQPIRRYGADFFFPSVDTANKEWDKVINEASGKLGK